MAGGHTSGGPIDAIKPTRSYSGKPPAYILKRLGKNWIPSAAVFGACAGITFLYFTDWQVFMNKVPFYRGKFKEREPIY